MRPTIMSGIKYTARSAMVNTVDFQSTLVEGTSFFREQQYLLLQSYAIYF
jgi:hypothetical protein